MKLYIGTKIIAAEPQEKDGKEGYKVEYEDGYISWSPKDVFETAYTGLDDGGMSFGHAIKLLKMGFKVARKGWNGKNQYIELATNISYVNADEEVVNCEHDAIGNKAIAFVGTSGVQMGWLASQADMLAEDWMVVA